jgi:actin-related protein
MKREIMSDDATQEVAGQITDAVTQSMPDVAMEENPINGQFTAEDLAKARAQEKAKLYPQVEKLQEEISALRQKETEREAKETERRLARQARDAEAAAEKKKQEEAELGFKELLEKKEQEFQAQLEQERLEREKAFALLEREREFQELQQYRQSRLEAERDAIIPELIDLISGGSKDEIEASIASLKERSTKIFDSVAQGVQASRKEMVGARITAPASGPLDNDSDSRTYSPNDISNMSMEDYQKNRAKLLGNSNNRGQGLFG